MDCENCGDVLKFTSVRVDRVLMIFCPEKYGIPNQFEHILPYGPLKFHPRKLSMFAIFRQTQSSAWTWREL